MLVLLFAAFVLPRDAVAFLISATADTFVTDSSQSLDDTAVAAERHLATARKVDAIAATDLLAGSIHAEIAVESQELLGDCCSTVGRSAGGVLDDEIIVGAEPSTTDGTLTLTLTGLGRAEASDIEGTLDDFSWGAFRFALTANLNGSSDASGEFGSDTREDETQLFETDLGEAIDVTTSGGLAGGTIVMVVTVEPGDHVDFRMTGGASAWSGRPDGAFGVGELTGAVLSVDVSEGLTWTSVSGALLTPEPTSSALGGVALAVVAAIARRKRIRIDGR